MELPVNYDADIEALAAVSAQSEALRLKLSALRAQRNDLEQHKQELTTRLLNALDEMGPYATFFSAKWRLDVRLSREGYRAPNIAEVPAAFVKKTRTLDKKKARALFSHVTAERLPLWLNRARTRHLNVEPRQAKADLTTAKLREEARCD